MFLTVTTNLLLADDFHSHLLNASWLLERGQSYILGLLSCCFYKHKLWVLHISSTIQRVFAVSSAEQTGGVIVDNMCSLLIAHKEASDNFYLSQKLAADTSKNK